jgi:hypothetical protein
MSQVPKYIYDSGDGYYPTNIKKLLDIEFIGSSKNTFYVSNWSILHLIFGLIIGYFYLYFKYNSSFYIFIMEISRF